MTNKEVQPNSSASAESSVAIYLAEIGKIPLLTREQEVELAQQIEAGRRADARLEKEELRNGKKRKALEAAVLVGNQARKTLARYNLRLVVSIAAKEYQGRGGDLLDRIQDGNVGLMRAVDLFDWRRGNKFSTYATHWIRQAISRGVEKEQGPISIPSHMHQVMRDLEKEARRLTQASQAPVNLADLAQERDRRKPPGALPATTRAVLARNVFSLDAKIKSVDGEEDSSLIEFVSAEEDPAKEAEQSLVGEAVEQVLDSLTDKERQVLKARYGLDGKGGETLQGVGNDFGVTRERVRQIQRRAESRLRHPRRIRQLGGFVDR